MYRGPPIPLLVNSLFRKRFTINVHQPIIMVPALWLKPIIGCRVAIHKFSNVFPIGGMMLVEFDAIFTRFLQTTYTQSCILHFSTNVEGSHRFHRWL